MQPLMGIVELSWQCPSDVGHLLQMSLQREDPCMWHNLGWLTPFTSSGHLSHHPCLINHLQNHGMPSIECVPTSALA